MRITRVQADAGWTKRMKRGTTAAPQTYYHPNSVQPDAGTALAGLERLQADLCRSLGRVHTCPSALPDGLLCWPSGPDARVWQSREDGLCRIPLPPLRTGHPSGVDARHIVVVFALCQGLCGQLGAPGAPGAPRGRDLSPHDSDGPGHVPYDLLPQRCGRVERVD